MKLIVLGVAAFVAGTAIGTGVVVARAPAKPASPAAAAASPAPVAGPLMASSPVHPAATAAAAIPATASSSPADPASSAGATPGAAPASVAAPALPAAIPARSSLPSPEVHSTVTPEDFGQVSKILSNMKPTDASRILVYLSDDQVEGILRTLGVRQAALLLAQMPIERAAALSRRLMHPNPEHTP